MARGKGKGKGAAVQENNQAQAQALLHVLHGGKLPSAEPTPEAKGQFLLNLVQGKVPPTAAPPSAGKGGKGKGAKGKGKGKGASGGGDNEVLTLVQEACADGSHVLEVGDFDYRSRRFLTELSSRHEDGAARVKAAIGTCVEVARTKERDDVDNWKGYVSKLLRREDQELYDELKERDLARRRGEQ